MNTESEKRFQQKTEILNRSAFLRILFGQVDKKFFASEAELSEVEEEVSGQITEFLGERWKHAVVIPALIVSVRTGVFTEITEISKLDRFREGFATVFEIGYEIGDDSLTELFIEEIYDYCEEWGLINFKQIMGAQVIQQMRVIEAFVASGANFKKLQDLRANQEER